MKYDHRTLFVTWSTLYNEMRFCYTASTTTSISWTNNRTSAPTPPYTREGTTTSAGRETYGAGRGVYRARNLSNHAIGCGKIAGFTVVMRQFGYRGGTVTSYRSPISSAKDC